MSIAAITTASSSTTTTKNQRSSAEPSTGFEGFFADAAQQIAGLPVDDAVASTELSLPVFGTESTSVDVSDFAEQLEIAHSEPSLEIVTEPQLTQPTTPFDFLAWAESARNPAVASNEIPTTEAENLPAQEDTVPKLEVLSVPEDSVAVKQQAAPKNPTSPDISRIIVAPDTPEAIVATPMNILTPAQVTGVKLSSNHDLSNGIKLKPSKAVFERIANTSTNAGAPISFQPIQLSVTANADVLNNTAFRQLTAEESLGAIQGKSSLQPSEQPKIVAPTAPALPNAASIQEKAQETMKWMLHQRIQSAEIRMNPEELGPISVRVRVEGGETLVAFYAHHETTRQLLEQSIPQLKDNMQSSGLQLSDSFVGKQSDQSSFAEFHQGQPEHGTANHHSYEIGGEVNASSNESNVQQSLTSQEGRVDIFA